MRTWIENNENDLLAKGTIEFVEGEVTAEKKPTFYVLATDEFGKEFRIFFESETVEEHKRFMKELEQVLRH
ncbi:MAG: hypothetical protein KC535_01625 [Nanoarchaeota archaeon]|nr:hypothetical protein [Nanoarchaeota archaeon]